MTKYSFLKNSVLLISAAFAFTGCLQTRNDVRETEQRSVMQQQVSTMQRANADASNRFADVDEQIRSLTGRVDVVENRLGQNNSGVESALKNSAQQTQDLNQKVALLQDALSKMEKENFQMNQEIQALKAAVAAQAVAASADRSAKSAKKDAKDAYEAGQEYFTKKDWKQAILQYQKYRDENPKGSHFADATYKIGVSFQELGMKDESKTFYDEVVNKFPKSEEARRAKIRIKGLKK